MRNYKGHPCKWTEDEWKNFNDPVRIGKQVCKDRDGNPIYHGDLFRIYSDNPHSHFHGKLVVAFFSRTYTIPESNRLTFRILEEKKLDHKEDNYSFSLLRSLLMGGYKIVKIPDKITLIDKKYEELYT